MEDTLQLEFIVAPETELEKKLEVRFLNFDEAIKEEVRLQKEKWGSFKEGKVIEVIDNTINLNLEEEKVADSGKCEVVEVVGNSAVGKSYFLRQVESALKQAGVLESGQHLLV